MNSIYMAPTENGFMPHRLPGPPTYPTFDETGHMIKPGERGGQFNPIKFAEMAGQHKSNQFDLAAGNRYQMS